MRSFAIVLLLSAFALLPLFAFANTPPVSNPGGPYLGVTEKPTLFDGSASFDADGDLLTFAWDFGDGGSSVLQNPSHIYGTPDVFTVTLTVNDGTTGNTQTTTATISLRAPTIPEPESGAPFISFPLQLDWEDVPEAQSYRYELIGYEEDGGPKEFLVIQSQSDPPSPTVLKFLEPQKSASEYQKECAGLDGDPDTVCNDGEFRTFVKNKQKRLWHAQSCEDTEGTVCGPWSAVWDFTYLLGPAVLQAPSNNAPNVALPVTLDWDDVPGAKSYELITVPCPPWGVQDPETDCYSIPISPHNETLASEYADTLAECLFTRKSTYGWQVASCLDAQASFCTHSGDFPAWSFTTGSLDHDGSPLILPAPIPLGPFAKEDTPPEDPADPNNIPLVSQNDMLRWSGSACAYFNRINIFDETGTRITENACLLPGSACTQEIGDETIILGTIEQLWEDLDKTYSWSVTPCWSLGSTPNCTDTTDSTQWYFHTTGKPPTLLTPEDNSSAKIPILLSWQGNGASYIYELSSALGVKTGTAKGTSETIGYEQSLMKPGQEYVWRVKTCVDEEGEVCGQWSTTFQFTTFPLEVPTVPDPPDEGTILLNQSVSWKSVDAANAYAYHLEYACRNEKENKEECLVYGANVCPDTSAIKIIEDNKVTARNSFELPYCMGQYEWKVLACLQDKCQNPPETRTTWSNGGVAWKLIAMQPPSAGTGLVPCGRLANDDATPYDETEKCELKHAGFLLQNLLDFILWKVSLFVLLLLAVITGATSYFSLGGPNALARIKTVFRSFFVGFLILMFAWMLVNIILMLFGFQFEFFGTWWELSF